MSNSDNRSSEALTGLWSKPGGYPFASLKNGKKVRVIEHDHEWRKLYFDDGVRGWVRGKHLTQVRPPSSRTTRLRSQLRSSTSHAGQQTIRTTNVADYSAYVNVNSGRLNVRVTPGGRVATSVAKGTHVRVLAHGGDWRQIYFNGRVQGWAHKNYLRR